MNIALIGYGKMGIAIEKIALERGHQIVARANSKIWDQKAISQADACIEFSHPEAVLSNINRVAALKKNVVIGTTGWYDHLEEVSSVIHQAEVGALYSPNFSVGVQLFFLILAHASQLMKPFSQYDAAGIEMHHNQKKDAPSGTALQIAKIIESNLERIKDFSFSSLRCGSIPGTHTVLFDSPCDTISITHTARDREGFAQGAVLAAEWLNGRKGLYTFEECMLSIIQERLSWKSKELSPL